MTATDEAGNPTKRSSHEWVYKVGRENVVKNETYEVQTMKMRPVNVPKEVSDE